VRRGGLRKAIIEVLSSLRLRTLRRGFSLMVIKAKKIQVMEQDAATFCNSRTSSRFFELWKMHLKAKQLSRVVQTKAEERRKKIALDRWRSTTLNIQSQITRACDQHRVTLMRTTLTRWRKSFQGRLDEHQGKATSTRSEREVSSSPLFRKIVEIKQTPCPLMCLMNSLWLIPGDEKPC
jgi:hypothetical protein